MHLEVFIVSESSRKQPNPTLQNKNYTNWVDAEMPESGMYYYYHPKNPIQGGDYSAFSIHASMQKHDWWLRLYCLYSTSTHNDSANQPTKSPIFTFVRGGTALGNYSRCPPYLLQVIKSSCLVKSSLVVPLDCHLPRDQTHPLCG